MEAKTVKKNFAFTSMKEFKNESVLVSRNSGNVSMYMLIFNESDGSTDSVIQSIKPASGRF
jgi:hypothetical protein